MRLALIQAQKNLGNTNDNPSVGCVIIKNNSVINVGCTSINGRPHAEANAIKTTRPQREVDPGQYRRVKAEASSTGYKNNQAPEGGGPRAIEEGKGRGLYKTCARGWREQRRTRGTQEGGGRRGEEEEEDGRRVEI